MITAIEHWTTYYPQGHKVFDTEIGKSYKTRRDVIKDYTAQGFNHDIRFDVLSKNFPEKENVLPGRCRIEFRQID